MKMQIQSATSASDSSSPASANLLNGLKHLMLREPVIQPLNKSPILRFS